MGETDSLRTKSDVNENTLVICDEHIKKQGWFKLKCSTRLSSAYWSYTNNFSISSLKRSVDIDITAKVKRWNIKRIRWDMNFAIYTHASMRKILISENKSEYTMLFWIYLLQFQKSKHQQTYKLWFLRKNMDMKIWKMFSLFQAAIPTNQRAAKRWEKNEFYIIQVVMMHIAREHMKAVKIIWKYEHSQSRAFIIMRKFS